MLGANMRWLFLLLLIVGVVSLFVTLNNPTVEKVADHNFDAICKSYGLKPGTREFIDCGLCEAARKPSNSNACAQQGLPKEPSGETSPVPSY
jgi:hypothetical protein